MSAIQHPSFLELDKLSVGAGADATRQHVAACTECSAHLSRVEMPAPLPEWVREPALLKRPASRWSWSAAAVAGACALAVIVTGVVRETIGSRPVDAYQTKGTDPGLALYIKRGDQIVAWDGRQPIRVGDLLRLQVAPEGFRHILVDSPSSPGKHLFDGELAPTIEFLPVSWKVDAQVGPEILEITLSAPGSTPWHSRLVLPKSTQP